MKDKIENIFSESNYLKIKQIISNKYSGRYIIMLETKFIDHKFRSARLHIECDYLNVATIYYDNSNSYDYDSVMHEIFRNIDLHMSINRR